ncbi:molybdenum-dependent transcriptional regulator [Massilia sp. KIM]|uniref:TOBE domain-containing protein n=1 Tax=Massilia sp. KIM TaxID=1955422 RepID=UPI00098F5F25|nr:TOBE domain-containing protein [Massilia sp. KIM]OON62120.1 molybdenum-dependent transcriptional regulator [Massilia sp. KIM]
MGIELQGKLWMAVGGENLGGHQRVELLAHIAQAGSITQAAKAAGLSYKAAWDAIDTMNNLAGEPLVERLTGGKGGGGTRLTARGQQLVDNFRKIEQVHHEFLERLNRQAGMLADDLALLGRLGMKTSARNQFFGTVRRVRTGAVNDEVELELAGGQAIVAVVTRESLQNLGLAPGRQAYALVKSSSVIVMTGSGARLSARNQLAGSVARVVRGAVNAEVVIGLEGGGTVAATITNESLDALALEEGSEATALFKASSVILGLP